MTRRSPLVVLLAVFAATGCGRGTATPRMDDGGARSTGHEGPVEEASVELWSLNIDAYVDDAAWDASAVSGDVFLLHTSEGVLAASRAVGNVLWRGTDADFIHPRGEVAPLYRLHTPSGPIGSLEEFAELDASTGAELRRASLDPPIRGMDLHVDVAGSLLVAWGRGDDRSELRAVDAATGRSRWSIETTGAGPALVLRDRIVLQSPYLAYSLADGGLLWSRQGACCDLLAGAGDQVYLRAVDERFALVDGGGTQLRVFDGKIVATSASHIALDTGAALQVIPHGGDAPVAFLPYAAGLEHTAVALTADAVYYFDQDADTLYRQQLDGPRTAVVKLQRRAMITTEKSGVMEPFLSFPPKVADNHVYVLDGLTLRAFELRPAR